MAVRCWALELIGKCAPTPFDSHQDHFNLYIIVLRISTSSNSKTVLRGHLLRTLRSRCQGLMAQK